MAEDPRLDGLPEAHALALRLTEEGVDEEGIATRLGIPVEAVAPLVRLATAKASRVPLEELDPIEEDTS